MYNGATATMLGGDVYKLESFDVSAFDMFGGAMDVLDVHGNSAIDIYGGSLDTLGAADAAVVNLYAYEVIYYPTGGYYGRGWVEGAYVETDLYFSFDLIHTDTFSHVNVVPEPSTIVLIGIGALILRRRKYPQS